MASDVVVGLGSKRERCTRRSWKGVTTYPPPPQPLRPAHNIFAPFGRYPLAPLAPPDLKELETTAKQATISRASEMEKVP